MEFLRHVYLRWKDRSKARMMHDRDRHRVEPTASKAILKLAPGFIGRFQPETTPKLGNLSVQRRKSYCI